MPRRPSGDGKTTRRLPDGTMLIPSRYAAVLFEATRAWSAARGNPAWLGDLLLGLHDAATTPCVSHVGHGAVDSVGAPSKWTEHGVMSVREAAESLGVSMRTVRRMLDEGRLTGTKVGPRSLVVDADSVAAAVNERGAA